MVAPLDLLRELDLLCRGQQIDLADVLEEELERVGGEFAGLDVEVALVRGVAVSAVNDLDLERVERLVEVVELRRLDVEVVERERDLLGAERPVLAPQLQ
jgi:hypothetical protein